MAVHNRSVPLHLADPPRALAEHELAALVRIADALIPARGDDPSPGVAEGYAGALDRALAARADAFEDVVALALEVVGAAPVALEDELRRRAEADARRFHALSSVLAGAYLILPDVRRRIGYPGQERRPAPFDQFAEEISDGILDPVIERGRIGRQQI